MRSRVLSIMALLALAAAPSSPQAAGPLSQREKIIHLLNRLGYGPAPGDIERVRSQGLEAYVEEQLHPERLAESELEAKLSRLTTLQEGPAELARFLPSRLSRKTALGNAMDAEALKRQRQRSRHRLVRARLELSQARIVRAVESRRQLLEVMVDFWMNHFNVFAAKGLDRVLVADYEYSVIRPHALGRFEDLLLAVARSPAMLFYLDNWMSSAPEAVMKERRRQFRHRQGRRLRPLLRRARTRGMDGRDTLEGLDPGERLLLERARLLRRAHGLNENYARELMELHTLGVDGGYTQKDVVEVARALTGWTFRSPASGGGFRFEPLLHDEGPKVVLGRPLHSHGLAEGEELLRRLARHPSTARFIATKLVRRFVSDDPPPEMVEAAARTFLETDGEIRRVLAAIFEHPRFFSREFYRAKVKKPLELVASSLRAVRGRVDSPKALLHLLGEMGEPLYLAPDPTGYPDVASAWINTNALLKRLNFALALAAGRLPGVRRTLPGTRAFFADLGLAFPSASQAKATRSLLPARGATREVALAAFMLGSPQFQKR